MRSHLYFFVLCLSVLITARASAQSAGTASPPPPKTPAAAQSASPAAKPDYSKEPFVEEDYSLKIAFQNDGTSTRVLYYRYRIQSDAGVQHNSVITIPYESATQTVDIDYIRVRKPDGTVVVTPPDTAQDMPADITRQAPYYSDLREKQVAVKGLSVGDVLEAQAHWNTTKPLAPGQFWFSFNFSHDNIALHEELQISAPKDRAVKWASPGRQPVITTDASRQVFTWTSSQLQSKSADDQKKEQDELTYEQSIGQLPSADVEFSSFHSWAEIGAWYNELQQQRVLPDAAIRAEAAELTKGETTGDAKLRAIYEYVATQIRYVGVAFGIGRYQPHLASEILSNQYGDCKDKHTLLASLLDAAGIKAYPVLINSTHKIAPDVPSPDQFDHVITAVPQGNNFIWLDTTEEVAPYGYLAGVLRNKSALLIADNKPAELVTVPATPPMPSLQTFHIDATIADDGTLKGKIERTLAGNDFELLFRAAFRSISMTQWKDLAQRISYGSGYAGDVSDVTISSPEKIDQPFTLRYTYTRKDYPQWSQHRVTVALPPMLSAPPDKKPSHPILLGDLGRIDYEAKVRFPDGYTPVPPAPVDLKQDFAEYHAAYRVIDGALETTRTLVVKMREVPVAEYDAYEKFVTATTDDYGLYVGVMPTHVTPASFQSALWSLPDSTNTAANNAYNDASTDFQSRDLEGGISALRHAVDIDPKFTRAWIWMGELYRFQRKSDEAISALRSAVANDPKQPLTYKALAFFLMAEQKFDDAISVWKQLAVAAPSDPDAPMYLGETLLQAKRYADAIPAFQSAIELNPKTASVYAGLGNAYLHSGDEANALSAYKKAIDIDSTPLSLNNIGYELADANKQLPVALGYAQKAVQQEEEAAGKVKLANLTTPDLFHTVNLASYWDTLGWVYFRMDKLDDAGKYLNAAWVLSQSPVIGDHLAQMYAKEHKKKEAIHTFRLALSVNHDAAMSNTITDHLLRLGAHPENNPLKFDGGAELSHARTFPVSSLKDTSGSAEFFLLFAPGPNGTKLEDSKFISGSDEMKDAGKALSSVDFNVSFPDQGPERLLRRGILLCDPTTHCTFVLYPTSSVRSVN